MAFVAFSALRVYALSGKRLWLLLVVLCFGVVLPAADLYQQTTLTSYVSHSPLHGCDTSSSMSLRAYQLGHYCEGVDHCSRPPGACGHCAADIQSVPRQCPRE
ncbi:hypothetical protein BD413DRAFT_309903 [Trametes elegans]|nr:hypothetical protein BD413DRAFT_309903 [Trametes elegans]